VVAVKFTWLWSELYKGLEISRGQRSLFIGWHSRKWREHGW